MPDLAPQALEPRAPGVAPDIAQDVPAFRRPSLWCGLFILACGAMAAMLPAGEPDVAWAMGYVILAAGIAEGAAGPLDSPRDRRLGRVDVLLGAISVAAGGLLLLEGGDSASGFMSIVAAWLLTRGGLDVLASFVMPNLYLGEGRALRAAVDLLLGLVCWIGIEMVAWLELLLGWPPTSVGAAMSFAALSLAAAGIYLVGASMPSAAAESPPPRSREGT